MARILALGDKRDYAWNGEKVTLSTVPTYEVLELRQALERSYDSLTTSSTTRVKS
jgi:hypothetical protein